MPTSSFDKKFVIADKESSDRFLEAMKNPRKVKVKNLDLQDENLRGLEALRRRYSADSDSKN